MEVATLALVFIFGVVILDRIAFNKQVLYSIIHKQKQMSETQKDAAQDIRALTDKVKGIDVKIQKLVAAAGNVPDLDPDLGAAIEDLKSEVSTTDNDADGTQTGGDTGSTV